MKAVLLAAGFGSRLMPITETVPKCLVDINGKPLLSFWLDSLFMSGLVDRVLLNTHHLSNKVVEFVENSRWKNQIDMAHEETILGTGSTLIANRARLEGEAFILAHADNLSLFNVQDFVQFHERRKPNIEITMMSFESDDPKSCGILELCGDKVVGYHEKVDDPPGNLANGAVFVLEPEVFEYIEKIRHDQIDFCAHVLPFNLEKIQVFKNCIYHRDIGSIDSLNTARTDHKRMKIFKEVK